MPQAIVRHHIEKIAGVSRTWFEWTWEYPMWVKTLVVEVEFDTDPNEYEFMQNVLNAIEETTRGVLRDETTMIVSRLKVVPRQVSAGK
jgi:hypothetical protein